MITNIILIVILLHLVIGFGWLMYKLTPRPGDKYYEDEENTSENL